MRIRVSLLAALATLVLAGSACGDTRPGDVAADPSGSPTASPTASPSGPSVPVPDGPVRTANLATVMDTGTAGRGAELCLGAVAESYPPQCGGPALLGWDWADHDGTYDQEGEVRWGTYALTGRWDGSSFTATDAVPGALYDPASPAPVEKPTPATAYDDAELLAIAEELQRQLAGSVLGAAPVEGQVLLDVVYDDGSLQQWLDDTYGAGVVWVSRALVDAG